MNNVLELKGNRFSQASPKYLGGGAAINSQDERVYFSDWVEYNDMVSNNISKNQDDYRHGTAVSSIIVDGPRLNPWLDDGCGRFRVRHFGVAVGGKFSSFSIIRNIKKDCNRKSGH